MTVKLESLRASSGTVVLRRAMKQWRPHAVAAAACENGRGGGTAGDHEGDGVVAEGGNKESCVALSRVSGVICSGQQARR